MSRQKLLFTWMTLPSLLLAQQRGEIGVSAVSPLRSGQTVTLSITSSDAAPTYRWSASGGRLIGSTQGHSVLLLTPEADSVQVSVLEETMGSTRLRNQTLLIAQAAERPATAPAQTGETEAYDIGRGGFAPSGWMGDGAEPAAQPGGQRSLQSEASDDVPPNASARSSRRWIYRPIKGRNAKGWVGVAFQYPADNWGDKPGRNLAEAGYKELSIWARGVRDRNGRFPIIQFKAGGGTDPSKPHQASFEAEGNFVTLTGEWRRYTVSLQKKDLKSVIAAFTFVLRADDNPQGAEFFLSQIEYR